MMDPGPGEVSAPGFGEAQFQIDKRTTPVKTNRQNQLTLQQISPARECIDDKLVY